MDAMGIHSVYSIEAGLESRRVREKGNRGRGYGVVYVVSPPPTLIIFLEFLEFLKF